MSKRAKVTFLLSIGTILNLFGYLYLTGSWHIFFTSNVPKEVFQEKGLRGQSIDRELSQVIQRAVDDHQMSQKNITNIINKFFEEKYPSKEAAVKNVPPVEEVKVAKVLENILTVKEEKTPPKKDGTPLRNIVKAAPEETVIGLQNENAQPPPIKAVQTESKKGKILSAVDAFMKGKVEKPVNPHDFNYMINEPDKCKKPDGSDADVFLLVVICSIHKNFENRNAIRQSWGSPADIDGRRVVTVFLLAKRSDERLQSLVVEENEQYHDIIMEDFDDTYKNLSLKTMMGMKWMSTFCAQAKYMLKTDDDMYVSYKNMVAYLAASPDTNFVTGMVINGGPIRDPKSKWYMPKDLYPGSRYPPFCSGTGYALSGDVPPKIYQTSLSTPYLYLEDVFVAICIDKLKIVPKNHREFHNWRTTYTFCHYKRILTAHMVTPTEMLRYWNDQKNNKHTC